MIDRSDYEVVDKILARIRNDLISSCVTCMHFNEDNEVCQHEKNPRARPPARVIAFGCSYHDNIPF